jgi:transposase
MADKLSKDDKVSLVFMYGVPGTTHRSVAENVNRQNQHRPPIDQSTVGRLISRFKGTGSVADRPRSGRPKSVTDEETLVMVSAQLTNSPKKSTRKLSQETGVSQRSVVRILRKHHFRPYKVQLVQDLHGDDTDRRQEF